MTTKGPHKSAPHSNMQHHDTMHGQKSRNHGMAGSAHPKHETKAVRHKEKLAGTGVDKGKGHR